MTDHVRKQIRDAAVTALNGLTTTGSRVYPSVVYPMQDNNLPGLRVDTNDEEIQAPDVGKMLDRTLKLTVQACVKETVTYNDTIDTIIKEVEVAIAANQTIGGAKNVLLTAIKIEPSGEAEKPIMVATMTFDVPYFTMQGTPTVAL